MGFWRRCTPSTSACAGVCVVALLLAALACSPTRARGAAPAVYVLGDSQADVGNNNYLPATLPMYKANYPHNGVDYPGGKPTGRFSNGYNFVDYLADSLGVASPPPYLSISNTSVYGQCISFDEQIDQHYSSVHATLVQQLGPRQASTHLAESLFSVAIGSNDISPFPIQQLGYILSIALNKLPSRIKNDVASE
uniref:GDSL esterase/lipase n=1 Tax=Oryza meridionalis TaxID=40149 RepID=A0A0E0D364_9ORYZ